MSESAIEKELVEVTNVKRRRKEDYQEYMQRMCDAIDSISKDDWETLSEEAQQFANTLMTAEKDKEDYPPLPDIEDEKSDVPDDGDDQSAGDGESDSSDKTGDDDVSTATETTSEGRGRRSKRSAASEKEAKTERKEKKEKAPREMSLRRQLKIWVAKKPKITVDELMEKAEKAGFKEFSKISVSTARLSVRDTLKVAKEAGVVLADIEF